MRSAADWAGQRTFSCFSRRLSKGGVTRLPDEPFSIRDLGETIAKMLGLRPGNTVEIQRDRLNPDRLMIIRRTDSQ